MGASLTLLLPVVRIVHLYVRLVSTICCIRILGLLSWLCLTLRRIVRSPLCVVV